MRRWSYDQRLISEDKGATARVAGGELLSPTRASNPVRTTPGGCITADGKAGQTETDRSRRNADGTFYIHTPQTEVNQAPVVTAPSRRAG